jgi:hypothetical protein
MFLASGREVVLVDDMASLFNSIGSESDTVGEVVSTRDPCRDGVPQGPACDERRSDPFAPQPRGSGLSASQCGKNIPSLSKMVLLYLFTLSPQSWFCSELNALKPRPEDAAAIMSPTNLEPLTGMTPSFGNMPMLPFETNSELLQLPLSREMAL